MNARYRLISAIYDTDEHISRLKVLIGRALRLEAFESLPMLQDALKDAKQRREGYMEMMKNGR